MMPVLFSGLELVLSFAAALVLVLFSFLFLADEILVQLPQLELQLFKRLPIGLVLRVALKVAAPSVSVLHDDVLCGLHHESIAGHFICASEELK